MNVRNPDKYVVNTERYKESTIPSKTTPSWKYQKESWAKEDTISRRWFEERVLSMKFPFWLWQELKKH